VRRFKIDTDPILLAFLVRIPILHVQLGHRLFGVRKTSAPSYAARRRKVLGPDELHFVPDSDLEDLSRR
jgi:hypothetical protein